MNSLRRLRDSLFEDTSRTGKLTPLDGLRAVAVLIVFLSHTSLRGEIIAPRFHFGGIGHLGVYLFFVLSGFLLAHTVFEVRQSVFSFYVRRFSRIFPLYALVVSAVFWQQGGGVPTDKQFLFVDDGWPGYLRHLAFLQGDGLFWTIAAEFQFYFILPFIAAALLRWGNMACMIVAAFTLFYGAWYTAIMAHRLPETAALRFAMIDHPGQFLDVFLCGVLAAYAHRSAIFRAWFARQQAWLEPAILGLIVVGSLGSLVTVAKWFLVFYQPAYWVRDLSLVYGVGFAVVLFASINGHRRLAAALSHPWLRFIGVIAFGWYLLHLPIIQGVNRLTEGTPLQMGAIRFAISFILSCLAGTLCYLLVEKPAIQLGKRLLSRRKASPNPAP